MGRRGDQEFVLVTLGCEDKKMENFGALCFLALGLGVMPVVWYVAVDSVCDARD